MTSVISNFLRREEIQEMINQTCGQAVPIRSHTEINLIIVIGITAVASVLLTSIFWMRYVSIWRIRWIEMEHNLARATGRKPRKIKDIK